MTDYGLSIIIPSRSRSNLEACLDAIWMQDSRCNVIVVDDGLEDGPPLPCDPLIVPGIKPFVYARNVNIGIEAALEHHSVILLNDDAMLATFGGFRQMQTEAMGRPSYGLVASSTNVVGNHNQYPRGAAGIRDEPRTLAFVCVFVPRATIDRVGMLDERFTAYGWEDNDYCRRVRNFGLKLGVFDGCYVDHGSLVSTFRGHPLNGGEITRGASIYKQKWGDLN